MPPVNHLKDLETQKIFHAVAYGRHLVAGNLAKSIVTGAHPTHVITLQQMLGQGPWDGCEALWFKGIEVKPDKYTFHKGELAVQPVHKTYTADSASDFLTSTAHGYANGDQVMFAPGSLPTPLAVDTVYYVRNSATNNFKVAATPGGAAIDITTNGSGTLKVWKNDPATGVDPVFPSDTPHSGIAWIRAELASGTGEADTKATPPVGLRGIFRTTKCQEYDDTGDEIDDPVYSTNPAHQVADLILKKGGLPKSRIDWPAWCAWRDHCAEQIAYDYTVLPDFDGIGLLASFYNGNNFETFVGKWIDPVIEFTSSAGSPRVGVDVDNFSARYEGKIKPLYTETYTLYITHTHGVKVWVDNMVTPLIDQWTTTGTHSATIALTAGQFHSIRIDWKHTTGNAELRLEWASTSQPREVVSHRVLYPKTEYRPRYETHPFWAGPTRLDDAVRTVLNLCNSTMQEVDGKLKFFCLEQLEYPSYFFTNNRIKADSLVLKPRDPVNLRNSWQAHFRDIDAQYLDQPIDPILIERPDLIDLAGRRIDGEAIELYNCSVHQAYRILDNVVRRNVDGKFTAELTGMPDSFQVLAGDRVAIDVEYRDWSDKQMLVLESNDLPSETTADERTFIMQEWPVTEAYMPRSLPDMLVFDAGSPEVNGRYLLSGTLNDHAQYIHEVTDGASMFYDPDQGSGGWVIHKDKNLYFAEGDVATPDLASPWTELEGELPIPSVLAAY